ADLRPAVAGGRLSSGAGAAEEAEGVTSGEAVCGADDGSSEGCGWPEADSEAAGVGDAVAASAGAVGTAVPPSVDGLVVGVGPASAVDASPPSAASKGRYDFGPASVLLVTTRLPTTIAPPSTRHTTDRINGARRHR